MIRVATDAGSGREVVLRYYLYRVGVSVGFVTPVFTLFLLDRGLSYTAISLLSGIYGVVTVAGELPTGYLGDRVGRRESLLAGSVCTTASLLGFAFVSGFGAFAALYVLWGLGLAFRSGTADAWLYDALAAEGASDVYTHVRGRGEAVGRSATLVGMLAGGALFALRAELPFLAAGLLNAGSIAVVASFPRTDGRAADERPFSVETAVDVLRRYVATPRVRGVVASAGLVLGTAHAAAVYVQPIATEVVGLPVASLGGLYAGMALVAAVSAGLAGPFRARLDARDVVVAVGAVLAVLLVLSLADPLLALVAFVALDGTVGLLRPVTTGFLGDATERRGRATVLSAAALVYALVRLPLVLASGVVADAYGPLGAFGFLGAVCGGGTVVVAVSSRSSASEVESPPGEHVR